MSLEIPIYQVDAFADEVFSGNPAAVCPLQAWLSDGQMQSIAAENNLSETAFLVQEEDAYAIRWFTPLGEVDLCGHATLASAYVIYHYIKEGDDPLVFHSASGPLKVVRNGDLLQLDFPVLPVERIDSLPGLEESLGVCPEAIYSGMDHMAVLADEAMVRDLEPNFHQMKTLKARGVIITAAGTEEDFVSRFFAPACGLDEDPVTGSAHCILAPYWAERLGKTTLAARQLSRRGGSLACEVQGNRVLISGKAVPYMEGTIRIPR